MLDRTIAILVKSKRKGEQVFIRNESVKNFIPRRGRVHPEGHGTFFGLQLPNSG